MADCPDCEVPLSDPNSCVCGWKKSSAKGGYVSPKQCTFKNNGRRCELTASSNDGGSWFCGWHLLCVNNPNLIRDYVKFEKYHSAKQDPWDERAKKAGLPLSPNEWRGTPMRLWQKVGGEHGSNYQGDRKQASGGSSESPQDYLDKAKHSLGGSGRVEKPQTTKAEIEVRRRQAAEIVAQEEAKSD